MIRLLALCLFVFCCLSAMDKPPQKLIRVFTADQSAHWDLEKDVVDQMGVLAHQIKDGNPSPFIPINLGVKRFEKIVRLARIPKERKEKLNTFTSKQLVQIASIADCLAAHSILKQTLSVLCKRPLAESQSLPESLQQALIAKTLQKNHYLKTVLLKERELNTSPLKDTDRMANPRNPDDVIEPTDGKDFEYCNKRTGIRRLITCAPGIDNFYNGHRTYKVKNCYYPAYRVHYGLAPDKAVLCSECNFKTYLILCDLKKTVFLQKWRLPANLNSMVVHENGIVAKLEEDDNLFFGDLDSSEWKLYQPFKSSYPISLTINRARTKVVTGSAHGQLAVIDLTKREKKPLILGCHDNFDWPAYRNRLVAFAFHPQDDSIASASSFGKICFMLLDSKKNEYIGQHGKVESMAFNNTGDLLITAGGGNRICIWSVLLKQLLHIVKPPKIQLNDGSLHEISKFYLSFSDDDRLLMLESAQSVIKFVNEETAKNVEFLPLKVVDFLIEIGRQMAKKERQNGLHEEQNKFLTLPDNYKPLYNQLPPQLKTLIKKNVSWNDWIWL